MNTFDVEAMAPITLKPRASHNETIRFRDHEFFSPLRIQFSGAPQNHFAISVSQSGHKLPCMTL